MTFKNQNSVCMCVCSSSFYALYGSVHCPAGWLLFALSVRCSCSASRSLPGSRKRAREYKAHHSMDCHHLIVVVFRIILASRLWPYNWADNEHCTYWLWPSLATRRRRRLRFGQIFRLYKSLESRVRIGNGWDSLAVFLFSVLVL